MFGSIAHLKSVGVEGFRCHDLNHHAAKRCWRVRACGLPGSDFVALEGDSFVVVDALDGEVFPESLDDCCFAGELGACCCCPVGIASRSPLTIFSGSAFNASRIACPGPEEGLCVGCCDGWLCDCCGCVACGGLPELPCAPWFSACCAGCCDGCCDGFPCCVSVCCIGCDIVVHDPSNSAGGDLD